MQKKKAIELLELPLAYDMAQLKKKYHIKALKYHPDKNPDECAKDKFQEINEAYHILAECDTQNEQYVNIGDKYNTLLDYIITHVTNNSETILEELDVNTLKNIRRYVTFCRPPQFATLVNLVDVIILRKEIKPEIILQPTLDDLLNQKIYKYTRGEKEYMVPLWHSEMIFIDSNKQEFMIKCEPILSPNIDIDSDNNIHYHIKKDIRLLISDEIFIIKLGSNQYELDIRKVYIRQHQIYTIKNGGIPIIQYIAKTMQLGDIVIHLELF
jgi:hypothetical protein